MIQHNKLKNYNNFLKASLAYSKYLRSKLFNYCFKKNP